MRKGILSFISLALLLSGVGLAGETAPNVVDLDVPDVELLDQYGEPGKFVSNRIGDNIAAVTFTFTHCSTICPTLDGIFKRLQDDLADDLGTDAVMLTLSVDPVNDIPERLKQRAGKLEARPGWTFLTGEKDTVNNLLRALEVYTPDITEHPPTVFVVDGRRGVWTRLTGFPTPARIVKVMDGYRAARSGMGSDSR